MLHVDKGAPHLDWHYHCNCRQPNGGKHNNDTGIGSRKSMLQHLQTRESDLCRCCAIDRQVMSHERIAEAYSRAYRCGMICSRHPERGVALPITAHGKQNCRGALGVGENPRPALEDGACHQI